EGGRPAEPGAAGKGLRVDQDFALAGRPLRRQAGSHRYCTGLEAYAVEVGAGLPAKGPAEQTHQPTATAAISATLISRMRNFCTFPVTVIGNSSTKRICRGTLKWAIRALHQPCSSSTVALCPGCSLIQATDRTS